MKKLRRFLCALMCTVLCTGMVQPMLAADTAEAVNNGAGGTVIKDAYDPFDVIDAANYDIWLYESAETLNNKADSFAALNPTVVKSGSTERTLETKFVEDPVYGVKCVTTVYEPIRKEYGYYRFTTYNAGNNRLSVDLNYIAITYMTPAKGEYQLKFLNSGGDGSVVFTHNTSVSKGKWTTAYVKVDGENKTNIMNRLNKGGGNMRLVWGSTAEGEELYIREIVFFKNEADVKTYAEVAPAYYNGEDLIVEIPRSEEYERKLMLMAGVIAAMRGARWNAEEKMRTTNPLEWIDYAAHWNWRNSSEVLKGIDGFQSKSSAVSYVEYGNDRALKLEYTNDANYAENTTRGFYRLMFTPTVASKQVFNMENDYYAAITYSSNKESEMKFFNAGSSSYSGPGEVIFDIANTDERWATAYVKIEANSKLLDRLAHPNTLTIYWNCDQPDGELYISEIVFFRSEALAKQYCEYAKNYYNNLASNEKVPSNPLDTIKNEIVFDFSSKTAISGMLDTQESTKTSKFVDVEIDGISATKFDGLPTEGTAPYHYRAYLSTRKAARDQFTKKAGDIYIAITYMCDGSAPITFKHGAGADQVTFGTTAPSNTWQSMAFNGAVTPKLLGRLNGTGEGGTVVLQWETVEAGKTFYVKEMVFFDSLADAEKYAENAPAYYNYLAGYKSAVSAPLTGISADNYDIWCFDSVDTLRNSNTITASNGASVKVELNPVATVSGGSILTDQTRFTTDPTYGVKCITTNYEPIRKEYGYYRITAYYAYPSGSSGDLDYTHVAVTYMTPDAGKHSLKMSNSAITLAAINANNSVVISADTSVSKGRWMTEYVEIGEAAKKSFVEERLNKNGKNIALFWTNNAENGKLYVRDIVFFNNEADAKAYTAAAPAYYNQMPEKVTVYTDPLDGIDGEIVWDFSTVDTFKATIGTNIDAGATSNYANDKRRNVSCVRFDEHATEASNREYNGTNFNTSAAAGAKFTGSTYYAAITYTTTGTSQSYTGAALRLLLGNPGTSGGYDLTFEGTTKQSNEWTTAIAKNGTTVAPVSDNMLSVIKTGKRPDGGTTRLMLRWYNADNNLCLYIKEVVFFTSLEDAQAYAAKAPLYYNNYNK